MSSEIKFKTIELRRSECFGASPVYQFIIDSSGNVTYYGLENVSKMGAHTWSLNEEVLQKIQNALDRSNYFSIEKGECEMYMTCTAFCITSVELMNGTCRKILHDLQDDDEWPKSLEIFEKEIETILGIS